MYPAKVNLPVYLFFFTLRWLLTVNGHYLHDKLLVDDTVSVLRLTVSLR